MFTSIATDYGATLCWLCVQALNNIFFFKTKSMILVGFKI